MMDFTYAESMQLINAFKRHPILWNTNMLGYNDRKNKAEAWKTIAGEVSMHPEICKRKLESLLSSCRREKAKIVKSRASGNEEDFYEPKWRYWNAFKFLRGLGDEEEDPLGAAPEQDILEPKVNSPWSTSRMLAHKYRKTNMPPLPNKPPVRVPAPVQASTQAAPKEDDEYSAIGVTVEAKLRKMDFTQRLFCENIIHQALYKGLLFQLTQHSEIRHTDFQTPTPAMQQQPITQTIQPKNTQEIEQQKTIQVQQNIGLKQQTNHVETGGNLGGSQQWSHQQSHGGFAGSDLMGECKNAPLAPTIMRLGRSSVVSDSGSRSPNSEDFKEITML